MGRLPKAHQAGLPGANLLCWITMKSNAPGNPGQEIRWNLLWPIVLLLGIVLLAAVVARRSQPPPPAPAVSNEASAGTPVSNAASAPRHIAPSLQSRLTSPAPDEPATARLISIMLDSSAPLNARRQAARSLAKIGSEEAMAALKSALTSDTPPYVKAAIAEGLGQCPNPESSDLLRQLVNGRDETVARGAARGFASRGDADAVNTLGNLLFNDQTPLSVRTEAALALGDVELPSAQDYLTKAISQIHDDDVLESALDGLGRRPFSETETFFRNYLNSPDVPASAKVMAIESVRDADGDVAPFLANYLNDPIPEVRAAAKDALDFLDPNPPGTPQVK